MTKKTGIHCFVGGKVQGVWYRATTKEVADQLGITGFAKNLPDGQVEIMAFGEEAALAQLRNWMKDGPPKAMVTELTCEEIGWQAYTGFKVL